MRSLANSNPGIIATALLAGAIGVASLLLLDSDGLLYRQTRLDLHYLSPWIVAGAALFALGSFAALAHSIASRSLSLTSVSAEKSDEGGDIEEAAGADDPAVPLQPRIAAAARTFLQRLALAVLLAGLLAAVPNLPATVSEYADGLDLDTLVSYLNVFDSLAVWSVLVAAFFIAARSAKEIWPVAGKVPPFPWRQLTALAVAYALLSGGGVLSVAFGFAGGLLLLLVALAMALPYLASVLRIVAALPLPRRSLVPVRVILLLSDCGWIALLLGLMVSLPSVADGLLEGRHRDTLEHLGPYFEILDTLAFWSIILLVPFILIRAVAAFRPAVGDVFGFPMGRIILFALALIGFSDNGIPATASEFPIPKLIPAMGAALAFSYLTLVLRRVARLGLPPRIARPMTNIPPLAESLARSASLSVVVWAGLDSLPLVSGPLLDHSRTLNFGEKSLPYFANIYEARGILTAFFFVTTLTLSLPDPLWSPARWQVRPLLAAVGFTASGCLLWVAGAHLSVVGHVFLLAAAVGGAGLLSLGLSQLAAYWTDSTDSLVAGVSRWFLSSKLRGFLIGAALVFYGMLLRPLLYDKLWFAAVYEWMAVLVVAVWALFKIRGSLKTFVESAEASPTTWTGWNRHQQILEDRPDPRWELMGRWQQRFLESGEWTSLWAYLMGLLCRNNAPPESARDVFRPLRDCVAPSSRRPFWRRGRKRAQSLREVALSQSLHNAERALAAGSGSFATNAESALGEFAGPYIEDGAEPEAMATAVIAAYHERGADLNHAINLWFPLVIAVNRPPGWFEPPWVRRRNRLQARERRQRLVEEAVAHLSGQVTISSLSVAVAARQTPLFSVASTMAPQRSIPPAGGNSMQTGNEQTGAASSGPEEPPEGSGMGQFTRHRLRATYTRGEGHEVSPAFQSGSIAPGQGIEFLSENDSSYYVRVSENLVGYVYKYAISRQPILPGDEVGATQ